MIEIISGSEELLSQIGDMWRELNSFHASRSKCFPERYADKNFPRRCSEIVGRNRLIRVSLARMNDARCGYCVSSVQPGVVGEIDSLFVCQQFRGLHVGRMLVDDAINWFSQMKTEKNVLSVYEGNESVRSFYAACRFYPKETIFEMKKENTKCGN